MGSTTATEAIAIGQLQIRFLVDGSASGGALSLFDVAVPPGARVPAAHSHDAYDETIYGLDGTMTWTLAGEPRDLGPGEALFIPRGAVHRFDNHGDGMARALAVVRPALLGPAYFRELAEVVSAGGPPDPAAIAAVMARHGLTPAP